jgi:hypothetical protein
MAKKGPFTGLREEGPEKKKTRTRYLMKPQTVMTKNP